jgi:hypothetical protein
VRMKRLSIVGGCAIVGMLLTVRPATQELAPARADRERVPVLPDWPAAPDVPLFGTPASDTILVFVVGEIKQPGGYYLPGGALVRDVINAAHGLDQRLAVWSHSGILRPRAGNLPRVIQFRTASWGADLTQILESGDQLFIGTHSE